MHHGVLLGISSHGLALKLPDAPSGTHVLAAGAPIPQCSVQPVNVKHGASCKSGVSFGCVEQTLTMWVTRRCMGQFRCAGVDVNCTGDHPMPSGREAGRSRCNCVCPAPFVAEQETNSSAASAGPGYVRGPERVIVDAARPACTHCVAHGLPEGERALQ